MRHAARSSRTSWACSSSRAISTRRPDRAQQPAHERDRVVSNGRRARLDGTTTRRSTSSWRCERTGRSCSRRMHPTPVGHAASSRARVAREAGTERVGVSFLTPIAALFVLLAAVPLAVFWGRRRRADAVRSPCGSGDLRRRSWVATRSLPRSCSRPGGSRSRTARDHERTHRSPAKRRRGVRRRRHVALDARVRGERPADAVRARARRGDRAAGRSSRACPSGSRRSPTASCRTCSRRWISASTARRCARPSASSDRRRPRPSARTSRRSTRSVPCRP